MLEGQAIFIFRAWQLSLLDTPCSFETWQLLTIYHDVTSWMSMSAVSTSNSTWHSKYTYYLMEFARLFSGMKANYFVYQIVYYKGFISKRQDCKLNAAGWVRLFIHFIYLILCVFYPGFCMITLGSVMDYIKMWQDVLWWSQKIQNKWVGRQETKQLACLIGVPVVVLISGNLWKLLK